MARRRKGKWGGLSEWLRVATLVAHLIAFANVLGSVFGEGRRQLGLWVVSTVRTSPTAHTWLVQVVRDSLDCCKEKTP